LHLGKHTDLTIVLFDKSNRPIATKAHVKYTKMQKYGNGRQLF